MARTPEEKDRYRRYITESPVWKAKRHAAVDVRAGGICEFELEDGWIVKDVPRMVRCTAPAVHCHHLTYKNLFNEPLEDLQALCNLHHKVVHVWARKPKCWCGNDVFDSIEDVIAYVEEDEYRDWDELYDNVPTTCSWCTQVRCRDDEPSCRNTYEDRGRQGGRSNEHTNHTGQPNGQCPPGLITRTPMHNTSATTTTTGTAIDDGRDVPTIKWVRWLNLELELDFRKIAYEYCENVPLSSVDVRKSRENKARLGPAIIEENVDAMVLRAKTHGILEMIPMVGWWTTGPKPQVIYCDGNNRDLGLRRLYVSEAAMYILTDPGPNTIALVTQICNSLIGLGSTQEERISHAMAYYRGNPGCSYKEAAATQAINPGLLSQRVKVDDLERRLAADGDLSVIGSERFNNTMLSHLSHLESLKNNTVLKYVAEQLLTIHKLKHTHADRLQKAVRATKPSTQEAQMATVDAEVVRYKAELASETGPQRGPQAKPGKLLRGMRTFKRLLESIFGDGSAPKDVLVNLAHRAEYTDISKDIKTQMAKIDKGLS